MRKATTAFLLGTALLAGCSKQQDRRQYAAADAPANKFGFQEARNASTDIDLPQPAPVPMIVAPSAVSAAPASREEMAAPGIAVTAAPGVAFNYAYAFVLPDKAISAIQEQHATACEKLGPQHCRIVGMRYSLVGEDEVRGQLRFKLDPALARAFGKEGIAAVERAKGRLVDAAIEGNDVATAITQSQRRSQQIAAELAHLDRQLAGRGLNEGERQALKAQADRLRQQQTFEQDRRVEGEEMLANTPMVFNYAGKEGFTLGDDPIGDAWTSSRSNFTTMISLILLGLGAALPWMLLVALFVLAWRKSPLRDLRWGRKETERETEPAA